MIEEQGLSNNEAGISRRLLELERSKRHSFLKTLVPITLVMSGLIFGAWSLLQSHEGLERLQEQTREQSQVMVQQLQTIQRQTLEITSLQEIADRSSEKLDMLNAHNIRLAYQEIIKNQNLPERLEQLRNLQGRQELAFTEGSDVLVELATQIANANSLTVQRIKAEQADAVAEQERLQRAEEERVEAERQRLEAIQRADQFRQERICLNSNCSAWILP